MVQETFLRAYRSWHTFIPGTDCRRWLFTICRNVFLRSRERQRPTVDLEDGEQDAVAAGSVYAAARERGYDDIYARLDLAPALREALDELAEPFRSAVILVDVEDLSYESAAEVMGVPIGTVRSRLFRGRRLLQEKLVTVAEDLGFPGSRCAMMSAPARSQLEALGLSASCAEVLRHLWDYLDEQITPTSAERLRAHIATCAQCRQYEEYQECFLRAMSSLKQELDAPALAARAPRRPPQGAGVRLLGQGEPAAVARQPLAPLGGRRPVRVRAA